MLSADRPQFRAQLERAARVFDRQITEPLLDDYWQALRDLSLPVLTARMDSHLRAAKFFPKPRELRENPDGDRRVADTRSPEVVVDDWTATLNRIVRDVLMATQAACSASALDRIVAEKNRLASQMREAAPTPEEWAEIAPGIVARFREWAA